MTSQPKTKTTDIAKDYLRRGWQPLPIAYRSKNPNFPGWQKFTTTEKDLHNHFNGAAQNIGVLVGRRSNGLTDIDLDSPESNKIADYFLPKTESVFGRANTPRSHRLYICTEEIFEKFNNPFLLVSQNKEVRDKACIVEIRGKDGLQTVFPCSTHEDTGEAIEWHKDGEPLQADAQTLRRATARLASACLISKFWHRGKRNELNLALCGALLRNGFDTDATKNFIRAVCAAANDEETADRMKAVDATAQKLKRGEKFSGFPTLIELTDRKLVETICKWLQIEHRQTGEPVQQTDAPAEFTGEPIPLPEDVLPAPELDEKLIPAEWREWLTDIAERMQCPLDYPVVAAIVAASALVGNKIRIRPKQHDSWQVTANTWGAVVGAPSLLKSPAVNEGMFFFREIEKKERAIYEAKLKEADFDKEFADAKQSELKKLMRAANADKDALRIKYQNFAADEPKEKRLSTADATVEKLGELLNENENGILQIRDELTGWFRSLDRPGRESDRAFYLECWDGAGESKVDRIGRGSIPVKNLTLSIFGTIQPAMLKPFLRGSIDGDTDDGLIQRFQLLVYPNKPKGYTYIDRLPKGRDKARNSFKNLYELDPATIGAKQLADEFGGGYFVQFDNQAQEFFQTWLSELENDLRSDTFDTPALESHIAKYRSLMPSLALIFHLLACVSGSQSHAVSVKNAQLAAAWCSYLKAHAARIYQMAVLSEFDIAREILKKIQSKDLQSEFTAKDIYGKHWSKLSKPKDVQNGLDILVEYGYLSPVTINEGHRPKTVYFINGSLK
jgi:putative DNA primase/helicase